MMFWDYLEQLGDRGGVTRDVDVGLDVGPKPKIWMVYARKRKRGDVGRNGA
jgi:hypothetical protein